MLHSSHLEQAELINILQHDWINLYFCCYTDRKCPPFCDIGDHKVLGHHTRIPEVSNSAVWQPPRGTSPLTDRGGQASGGCWENGSHFLDLHITSHHRRTDIMSMSGCPSWYASFIYTMYIYHVYLSSLIQRSCIYIENMSRAWFCSIHQPSSPARRPVYSSHLVL